ncbi:MAG TPA: hypothetical protein VLG11_06220 [Candidatus Saccharimonadales bacterium]|nr:hypothetical protein [Candidatus Saccharimonadales bacterium]
MDHAKSIVKQYDNIRKKSWIVELLPWIGGGTSTTLYPYVYLSRATYKSIRSANPDPYKISTLIHEEEHIKRIKNEGARRWYIKYFLDRHFRLEEELAATAPQFSYLKSLGLTFDMQRKARVLAGHLYFWPVSRKEALRRLSTLWEKA